MADPRIVAHGIALRASLATTLLPRLVVGRRVPSCAAIGRGLGMTRVGAWKQVRKMLGERGVQVVREGRSRLVVVGMDSGE